jgi:histidinol-phosphate aminotransferase
MLEEIEKIAQGAKDRVFIVDEAYMPFNFDIYGNNAEKYIYGETSAVKLINKYENILTVHTCSKAFSLAGLRVGFAIGSVELIEGLCRVRDSFNSYTVDTIAQIGAAAAISDTSYYITNIKKVAETRNRISVELVKRGYTVLPSDANFIFARHPSISGDTLFKKLREKNILVRHFDVMRIKDFLRISVGTDSDMDVLLDVL